MRVRIVCYEDVNGWILGKFARKLHEELTALGVASDIAKTADPLADINHHIIYCDYDGRKTAIDTVMVTHIDSIDKLNMLKRQLGAASMAICMSAHTVDNLAKAGLDRRKLCYISPAHDSVMVPRKLALGITSKVHDDGRKNEGFLVNLCGHLSPADFMFRIMGRGWDGQIKALRDRGFEAEYHPEFDREEYLRLMPSLDYYLYMSHDEGSMGFIDALAAGVKTIVTPQGYHLDAPGGITHAIQGFDDLVAVLKGIAAERGRLMQSVENWTWRNHALSHLEVWERILGRQTPPDRPKARGSDGVASMLAEGEAYAPSSDGKLAYFLSLYKTWLLIRLRSPNGKFRRLVRKLTPGTRRAQGPRE